MQKSKVFCIKNKKEYAETARLQAGGWGRGGPPSTGSP